MDDIAHFRSPRGSHKRTSISYHVRIANVEPKCLLNVKSAQIGRFASLRLGNPSVESYAGGYIPYITTHPIDVSEHPETVRCMQSINAGTRLMA